MSGLLDAGFLRFLDVMASRVGVPGDWNHDSGENFGPGPIALATDPAYGS